MGESLTMIGKLLGHSDDKTTARYAHLAHDSIHASADRIADSIAADILWQKLLNTALTGSDGDHGALWCERIDIDAA